MGHWSGAPYRQIESTYFRRIPDSSVDDDAGAGTPTKVADQHLAEAAGVYGVVRLYHEDVTRLA